MPVRRHHVGHWFIAVSLTTVAVIITAAMLGLLRFMSARSSAAHVLSADAVRQRATSLSATFWRENSAALRYFAAPSPAGLAAADALHRQFQRGASTLVPAAGDAEVLSQAARDEVAYYRMVAGSRGAGRPQFARMQAAAAAVVAPLDHLAHLAREQQQASQQAESAAAGQVMLLAGGAMCGGGVVGGALAVFAGRLLGQASRREHELTAALAQLRELDRMKDEFIALVSHELRTPLTGIVGFLELLEDPHTSRLDEQQQRFTAAMRRNADRLQRLAADVRVLAGLQVGGLTVPREDTNLADLASRAVSEAGPQAERRRISLTLALPDGPLPPVRGDDTGLIQLIGHLLSNAVKFTPEGGQVRVMVTAEPGWAVLTVADTGIGISAEDQERIFERFYRAPVAGERAIQGSGLGLTICRALVEAHGGTITVQSAAGQGATFRVSLPLGSGPPAALRPASTAARASQLGPIM